MLYFTNKEDQYNLPSESLILIVTITVRCHLLLHISKQIFLIRKAFLSKIYNQNIKNRTRLLFLDAIYFKTQDGKVVLYLVFGQPKVYVELVKKFVTYCRLLKFKQQQYSSSREEEEQNYVQEELEQTDRKSERSMFGQVF